MRTSLKLFHVVFNVAFIQLCLILSSGVIIIKMDVIALNCKEMVMIRLKTDRGPSKLFKLDQSSRRRNYGNNKETHKHKKCINQSISCFNFEKIRLIGFLFIKAGMRCLCLGVNIGS